MVSLNSFVVGKSKPKIRNVGYTMANSALWKEKPKQSETQESVYIYESEISTRSQQEGEIKGGPK